MIPMKILLQKSLKFMFSKWSTQLCERCYIQNRSLKTFTIQIAEHRVLFSSDTTLVAACRQLQYTITSTSFSCSSQQQKCYYQYKAKINVSACEVQLQHRKEVSHILCNMGLHNKTNMEPHIPVVQKLQYLYQLWQPMLAITRGR